MLDSNLRNKRTIFAPHLFVFTYLPAKIKGARKFRGLQYCTKEKFLTKASFFCHKIVKKKTDGHMFCTREKCETVFSVTPASVKQTVP